MFVKNLEDLPEALRDQFVESELDGQKGYQDRDSVELKKHLFNVKNENKTIKETKSSLESKLTNFEKEQEQKIQEARSLALEEAKSKGDVTEIEKRYEQQMQDLEKRVAEQTRAATLKEIAEERAAEKATAISNKIGLELGVDSYAAEIISQIISGRVIVDAETNKEIFYNGQGGALSVDKNGFIEEIKKDPRFARLIKTSVVTNGGGNANGSGQSGATGKKFDEMSGAELKELRNQDPSTYDRLKNEYSQRA